MNANNYLIEAALDLGIIQQTDADGFVPYAIDLDAMIITNTKTEATVLIEATILSRATYLAKLAEIRINRNVFLSQSDWVFLSDSDVGAADKELWKTYRQQLRDCTSTLVEGQESSFVYPSNPFIAYNT